MPAPTVRWINCIEGVQMNLNIKPIQESSYDCITLLVATIAGHFKLDYQLALINHWQFLYKSPAPGLPELLGRRIKRSLEFEDPDCPFFRLLEKYHGIRLTPAAAPSFEEAVPAITGELQNGKPVIFRFVNRPFGWHDQEYESHYCLISGYDSENRTFMAIDPYISTEKYLLPLAEFKNEGCRYYNFELNREVEGIEKRELKSIYREILDNLGCGKEETNAFRAMEKFALELAGLGNLEKECAGFTDYSTPLFMELKFIHEGRINLTTLFTYLAEHFKTSNLDQKIEQAAAAAKSWHKVRLLAIKVKYMKKSGAMLERLAEAIREIAVFEEELAKGLLN